jgi:dihydroorotase
LFDLLIKGGKVIDPAQNIEDTLDIGITGDKIAALTKDIRPQEGRTVINAAGKIVTPGLIDMHCHVFSGVHKDSLDPDEAGIMQGITTVVDAGSSGQAVFLAFPKYIIPSSRTNVFCFLSLASQGHTVMPELRDWAEVDVDATIATIETNRDIIKGLKLRLVGNLVADEVLKVWEVIKGISKKVGLPIMVHPTDRYGKTPLNVVPEIIALLEPGDILTHVFTPQPRGCVGPDSHFYPEVKEAIKRGVILEANSGPNFNSGIAKKGLAEGIIPHTLTSDYTSHRLSELQRGLFGLMSKFLSLGLDLTSVIKMTTSNPARVLGLDKKIGSLKIGMDADISVMESRSGLWELDEYGPAIKITESMKISEFLSPCFCVKSGKPIAIPTIMPSILQ